MLVTANNRKRRGRRQVSGGGAQSICHRPPCQYIGQRLRIVLVDDDHRNTSLTYNKTLRL